MIYKTYHLYYYLFDKMLDAHAKNDTARYDIYSTMLRKMDEQLIKDIGLWQF